MSESAIADAPAQGPESGYGRPMSVEAWEQMTGLAARGAHKAGVAQQLNDRRP